MPSRTFTAWTTVLFVLVASSQYAAAAQYDYVAITEGSKAAKQGMLIAGKVTWICKGNQCTTRAPWENPRMDVCSALAEAVGPLRSFGHAKVKLNPQQLAQCNGGGAVQPISGPSDEPPVIQPPPPKVQSDSAGQIDKTPKGSTPTPSPPPEVRTQSGAGKEVRTAPPAGATLPPPTDRPITQIPSDAPLWGVKYPDAQRFLVLGQFSNEAVLDRETGVVWQRSPDDRRHSWYGAVNHCAYARIGGRMGWRLARIEELLSLWIGVGTPVNDGRYPRDHPFTNVDDRYFWSGTTKTGRQNTAFMTMLPDGNEMSGGDKSALGWAWCVRGGTSYDGQFLFIE